MTSRIVEFPEQPARNHDGAPGAPDPIRFPVRAEHHVHEWDVQIISELRIDAGVVPAVSVMKMRVSVDPMRRRWEISAKRETWDVPYVLRAEFSPRESPAQRAEREGQLRLLNEILSLAFGVPA